MEFSFRFQITCFDKNLDKLKKIKEILDSIDEMGIARAYIVEGKTGYRLDYANLIGVTTDRKRWWKTFEVIPELMKVGVEGMHLWLVYDLFGSAFVWGHED